MSTPVTLNGVIYDIPSVSEDNWGDNVSDYLLAIAPGVLTKAGGIFTLSVETDFGATYGLKTAYYKSRATNPSGTGILRLGNAESISWRNAANSADISLKLNASNILEVAGNPLVALALGTADQVLKMNSGGTAYEYGKLADANIASGAAVAYSKLALTGSIVNADVGSSAAIAYSKLALTGAIVNADIGSAAAIAYSKLSLGSSIVNADIGTSAAIAYSKLNLATSIVNSDIGTSAAIAYSKLALTGSILNADVNASAAIAYSKLALSGSILNADVNASAAIAHSKMAALTVSRALVSDGSGFVSVSTVTSTELGYVSGVTSALQTQLNGKQATGNYITALTGDVTASGAGSAAATIAATTNGTLTTLSALTTAGSLATVGTITSGTWSATTVAVNKGGTGVTSVTTSPAATSWAGWDSNSNLSANRFIAGYATTATAAGTTTLTVASAYNQYFTGSTTQTVVLPVASTLVLGGSFRIVNTSSGVVTIQSSGSNTVQAMAASTVAIVTCILTSGTSAASWSVEYISATGAGTVTSVAMTVPTFLSISGSPITTTGTLAVTLSGTALPVLNGGTGVTTSTGSGNNVLSTSPTLVTPALGAATGTSVVLTQTTGNTNVTLISGSTGTETFLTMRNSTPATVGQLQTNGSAISLMASGGFGVFIGSSGAVQLGDNNADSGVGTDLKHYASSSSNSTNTFVVRNWLASTPTNADNVAAFRIAKPSTTNTAGLNYFAEFYVNGETTSSGRIASNGANAAAFFSSSDRRLKKDIVTLDGSLELVANLNPVSYKWRADDSSAVGFIAQELEQVLPSLVVKTDSGLGDSLPTGTEPWSMTDSGFIPYIVRAIQELKAEFDAYKVAHP